jgi:isoleucyl-tRNA synthetase
MSSQNSEQPVSEQAVQEKNYKQTLNLPVTQFQMKAGAAKREPEIEAIWEAEGVYQKAQGALKALLTDKGRKFILHDGPPYLSSDKIHIGTALNKILKDIVTRYKTQQGFYSPYVPGYDGHGLPIENAVVKSLKGGRHSVTPGELRKLCREFALKNLHGQEDNFKRLGVWGNWQKPYITIDGPFEALQIKLFAQMYDKGYVYKGLKPVYWCPSCETALADAEVEYGDHTSHSVYVGFTVTGEKPSGLDSAFWELLQGTQVVIWTTTPWTLPANLALSVHPDFEYVVVQDSDTSSQYLVAKGLLEAFSEATGKTGLKTLAEVKGANLEGLLTQHPFLPRTSRVLVGTHVTLEAGTGIVHTAPGHGMEDYVIVQQYNQTLHDKSQALPILSPLDNRGVYTEEAILPELIGLHYEKGNAAVIELLQSKSALLKAYQFNHSYPHCWRCHKPVIYRATEQWFISVESFRQQALDAIKSVTWLPARGESRITSMVEGRGDWCISRQRVWGVPIPVFYCADNNCREPHLTQQVVDHLYPLFSEHTTDIWWAWDNDQLVPPGMTCKKCSKTEFVREMDIMDVWFDSGVTHTAVVDARKEELGELPVELYLEGSDQHRGWFQSSLLTSVMLSGKAPYKSVLTHGFVLDGQGRKMSKSLGNVVDPNTIIQQYGADVLRLWVASVDYTNDVRIGNEIVGHLAEVYKKVRNTIRYMMGNLFDFDPERDTVPYEQLSILDRYTLHRLAEVTEEITQSFEKYEFHRFYQVLQNFCVVDLSAHYFDPLKDVLYTYPAKGVVRRGVQTVLYQLLIAMIQMLVPVMPHLADDVWLTLPENQKPKNAQGKTTPSITMMPWPRLPESYLNPSVGEVMNQLLTVKDLVNKALESLRAEGKIKSALETSVSITTSNAELRQLMLTHLDWLTVLLIVSDVQVGEKPDAELSVLTEASADDVTVTVYQACGEKCQRCLKYTQTVGQTVAHPTLCSSCVDTVSVLQF